MSNGEGVGTDQLAGWLADGYPAALRTAVLLLHDRRDAEEAVQEAFLRAWRFRAAVPDGDAVKPWMYRVVVNACLSRLRADGRRRARTADGPHQLEDRPGGDLDVDPEARTVDGDTRTAVLAVLADLPDHLRVVVVLRYYAQLGEREIAEVIGRRPGTVKSRLHEARGRLGADARLAGLREADDRTEEAVG